MAKDNFNVALSKQRRLAATDPMVQVEKLRVKQTQSELPYKQTGARGELLKGKGQYLQSRVAAVQTGMSIFTMLKPILIGGLIILFLIGPGLSAIMNILGAMNLWMWLGVIILGILLWRRF